MLWLALACAAAVVASVGDVLMLYVATGKAPLASTEGRALLHVGGWLGVLAIPGYYLGYRERARRLPRDKLRTLASTLGALVAVLVAATHGLTAMDIHEALAAGAQTRLPQAAFVPGWSALFVCGVAAAIAALLMTVVLAPALWQSDWRRPSSQPIFLLQRRNWLTQYSSCSARVPFMPSANLELRDVPTLCLSHQCNTAAADRFVHPNVVPGRIGLRLQSG